MAPTLAFQGFALLLAISAAGQHVNEGSEQSMLLQLSADYEELIAEDEGLEEDPEESPDEEEGYVEEEDVADPGGEYLEEVDEGASDANSSSRMSRECTASSVDHRRRECQRRRDDRRRGWGRRRRVTCGHERRRTDCCGGYWGQAGTSPCHTCPGGEIRRRRAGSCNPTPHPTPHPTPYPTPRPTPYPTPHPTPFPTWYPTRSPTGAPTGSPTSSPTVSPTGSPTASPTATPTPSPTSAPTPAPTFSPTGAPTGSPTSSPTVSPTGSPTASPTAAPTPSPTSAPTPAPTFSPTGAPTASLTVSPTASPTHTPTPSPTFTVAGSVTLQFSSPDFSSARRLSAKTRQAKDDFSCGPGRGGKRKAGCTATTIDLDKTKFVPRDLLLIEGGLPIRGTNDITSCPLGWKVFSPTSFRDWDAVKAGRVREAPLSLRNMPVDVATGEDDPADIPRQSSKSAKWKTRDGSDWFMQATAEFKPSRQKYQANCYITIDDAEDTNNIKFAYTCVKRTSYLCQRQAVVDFVLASYPEMVAATEWLASAIMATRGGLAEDPFNLGGARLLVSGYIQPRGGRRLLAGAVGVETIYDVEVESANAANDLISSLTETANSPDTARALQEAAAASPHMPNGTNVTGAAIAVPQLKVDPRGPTVAPTAAPVLAPTVPATSESKTVGAQGPTGPVNVGATGDPHLLNMHGQRFDLMLPGIHVLLQIPRASRPEETLVRLEADARGDGSACVDMYFKALNITGEWASAASGSRTGLQYHAAAPHAGGNTGWMALGKLDLKVAWGHTSQGVEYLNLFARHLAQTGYPVGGLLGEDDHTKESTPPAYCRSSIALLARSGSPTEDQGSIAEVEAE